MYFKKASAEDFEQAYIFICQLWSYNTYNYDEVLKVYNRAISNPEVFAFFLIDHGEYIGFCHGDYIDTFWMSGQTCYLSSLITKEEYRGKGYGIQMMNYVKALAEEKGCKAIILDSGLPRTNAHRFYERYGFEKSCYGFELSL